MVNEISCGVDGRRDLGVAALNLGSDRAQSLLVLSPGLGNVGGNSF